MFVNFPVPRRDADVGHARSPLPGGPRGGARYGVAVDRVSEPLRGSHCLEHILAVDAVLQQRQICNIQISLFLLSTEEVVLFQV